ncbi:MAG: cyclic nucleotide-binding domain-containing protein [Planctomycetota bacterium]|jgi:Fe-S-cluster-containing hydrogenase component 2/CRP-like cAMP-binding protein
MATAPDDFDPVEYIGATEEALFARDIDGQLIRAADATLNDLDQDVRITIDGQSVVVKKAVPLRNSQGVLMVNDRGEIIPRPTTIYDAVTQLYIKSVNDIHPIPTLCHREHLNPVGVCRVCMVEIEERRQSGRVKRDLVSSCTYHVKEGMIITTLASEENPNTAETLRDSVAVIVELLASEHLDVEAIARVSDNGIEHEPNELKKLVQRFLPDLDSLRYPPSSLAGQRGRDCSSEIIAVDHDACIMCHRCIRACNDIKNNDVMARDGKGYEARIAFDTDLPMLESSCVSCGECVISCPTDALQFRSMVVDKQVERLKESADSHKTDRGIATIVTPEEMIRIPIFAGIPFKFLQFNGGACVRRTLRPGDVLCREGEYGATAFLIQRGKFEIQFNRLSKHSANRHQNTSAGWFTRWLGNRTKAAVPSLATGSDSTIASEGKKLYRGVEDVILGEMACLNRYPRTATVVAVEESEVIEIGSNVLYMLQRNQASRKLLNEAYRRHALNSDLERLPIFKSFTRDETRKIAEGAELMSVEPGQPIFREGETGDDLFLVRLGYVKVSRKQGMREQVVNYIGPGNLNGNIGVFGEIGALSKLYSAELSDDFRKNNYQPGIRTSSCTALDHVELVRIRAAQLAEIAASNPTFKKALIDRTRQLLEWDLHRDSSENATKASFVAQGLYNAQSLLVLDLESCTRCDECTRACADSHGGETRLIREGLRFENFLVATSCRSCTDPYCLVGCPVNAIFREGDKEIVIEDHCIGCGQCATNCPYGNISMYGHQDGYRTDGERKIPIIRQKATTCDQCKSIGGTPRCVYSCPHDAAFRMSGEELRQAVLEKTSDSR